MKYLVILIYFIFFAIGFNIYQNNKCKDDKALIAMLLFSMTDRLDKQQIKEALKRTDNYFACKYRIKI